MFTTDANEEIDNYRNSKTNFINLGSENIRQSSNEAVNAIYSLTKVLDGTKLTPMV